MTKVIAAYLKKTYEYSDYQIAQIKYGLLSMFYEVSKFLLMGIYFYFTGQMKLYLFSVIILCMLRTATGGLHFQHYMSCFAMTFAVFLCGVQLLPMIPVVKNLHMLFLLLCILINYKYAPIVSSYRPIPDGIMIRRAKIQSFAIISVYALFLFILPDNPYLTVGSWIIILQSLQLFAAGLRERRSKRYEQIKATR